MAIQIVYLSIFRRHMNGNLSQTSAPMSRGKRARSKGTYSSTSRHQNFHYYTQMLASDADDKSEKDSSSRAKYNEGADADNDNNYGKRRKLRLAKRGQRARDFRRLGFWYLTSSMAFILRKARAFFDGDFAAHESNRGNEFVVIDPYFSVPVIPPTTTATASCVV